MIRKEMNEYNEAVKKLESLKTEREKASEDHKRRWDIERNSGKILSAKQEIVASTEVLLPRLREEAAATEEGASALADAEKTLDDARKELEEVEHVLAHPEETKRLEQKIDDLDKQIEQQQQIMHERFERLREACDGFPGCLLQWIVSAIVFILVTALLKTFVVLNH